MSLKDILLPFIAWKNIAKKPVTIKDPVHRKAAERYRGFHKNDLHECIGCGTCEAICQNAAIDLVPVDDIETKDGDSGLRPGIDYGRCCWCALCVDICPTKSLTMSNEYIWIDSDPDAFRFVAGAENKPWDTIEQGYQKPDDYELYAVNQEHMEEKSPDERKKSFIEFMMGYSDEQARKEADRCVECGLCVATCPAHMDIPEYIRAIREQDMDDGIKQLYATNPLPETCGRICPQGCAAACAMKHKGDPINIRWLKRYIADKVAFDNYNDTIRPAKLPENPKKVAIIGAGPAGLTAAYYLRHKGVSSDIFEMMPQGGGMMRYGIPEYRMPKQLLEDEINYIRDLGGVAIHYSKKVGKDIQLESLKKDYNAVIVTVGSWQSSSMRVEGEELASGGIDFLEKIASQNWSGENPGKTIVVGGGNTAMDCVRTSIRLGSKNVSCLYRRTENEMPAEQDEIREAKEEGVKFEFLTAPIQIKEQNGKKILRCMKMKLGEPDASGRRRPVPIEGTEFEIEADTVIAAIGQSTVAPAGAKTNKYGDVAADSLTGQVDENIFAAGDCVTGPATVIEAVAGGKIAAIGVLKYLKID